MLPAGLQLCSLHLEFCNMIRGCQCPLHARSPPTLACSTGWKKGTAPGRAVQVSSIGLTLGRLSMEQYAKRLSQLATAQHQP